MLHGRKPSAWHLKTNRKHLAAGFYRRLGLCWMRIPECALSGFVLYSDSSPEENPRWAGPHGWGLRCCTACVRPVSTTSNCSFSIMRFAVQTARYFRWSGSSAAHVFSGFCSFKPAVAARWIKQAVPEISTTCAGRADTISVLDKLNESTPGMRARLRPQCGFARLGLHRVPIEPGGTGHACGYRALTAARCIFVWVFHGHFSFRDYSP